MIVIVRNGKESQVFRNIVAVGIGHLKQDLVLVERTDKPDRVFEVGTAYTSITVKKERV